MSMKKWTDEELIATRDNMEALKKRQENGANSKLGLLTALIGALAISTGVAFIFLDGIDILSIILIIMGAITCVSWFKNDKVRRDNITFLFEINKEIKSRKLDKSLKNENKEDKQDSDAALKSQLNEGIKVELEHTTSQKIAKEIAMDHLWEDPKYYDKLSQIEKGDINESENDLNVQDLIYKQDPQILKDGIKKELIFIKTLLPQTAKYAGKENREKFWNFIKSLKGKIKRVPLNSVFPTQSGDDYKNASSEAEAEEFEKVINGELSVNDVRKQNYYPLLINSTNDKIIDGHHRHYALTKINSPYAVCLFVDIPNEYLDEMYGNHEQMLIDRKKTVNESIDYGKALKAMAARKDPDKITDFGKEQLQEMDSNEIEYWANHYDIFKSLSSNISNFDKLKPKLKGKQLEALMYFYELINTENIQENEVSNQPQYQEYIDKAIKYACDELGIKEKPQIELMDEKYSDENHSFGGYNPSTKKVYLQIKNRNLKDCCTTLFHEINHFKQDLNGELNPNSGEDWMKCMVIMNKC